MTLTPVTLAVWLAAPESPSAPLLVPTTIGLVYAALAVRAIYRLAWLRTIATTLVAAALECLLMGVGIALVTAIFTAVLVSAGHMPPRG